MVASVLSGNRNFEGRINPEVRANYLMSPPLVVAYAIAGRIDLDLDKDPLGVGTDGKPVFLRDIWPSSREVAETMARAVESPMFSTVYAQVFEGNDQWKSLDVPTGQTFAWDGRSTYVKHPPYFGKRRSVPLKRRCRPRARGKRVRPDRRADWAAKGTLLLGVRAVIAESYERIHRSNLVGMGVVPLEFRAGESAETLGLTGEELYDIVGLPAMLACNFATGRELAVRLTPKSGAAREFHARVRIDTPQEILYYRHGGILQSALRQLSSGRQPSCEYSRRRGLGIAT